MKLASALGALLLVIVIGLLSYLVFFDEGEQLPVTTASTSSLPTPRAADDPTYGQELRSLTAKLKLTEQQLNAKANSRDARASELESNLAQLNQKINGLGAKERFEEFDSLLKQLGQQNTQVQSENNELRTQLQQISETLALIQTQQNDKDQLIESLTTQLQHQAVAPVAPEMDIEGKVRSMFAELQGATSQKVDEQPIRPNVTTPDIYTTTPVQSSYDHKPYGFSKEDTVELNPTNLSGLLGSVTNEAQRLGGVSLSNSSSTQTAPTEPVEPLTKFPVYTLPATTMLTDSLLLTPLIGRVPLQGNVNDPFRFQLEVGADNLAANGHRIPGIRKAMIAGVATGIREQSCVRGLITTMTFIFEDGRIHSVDQQSNNTRGGIGYLADPWGKPCIRGQYINNASSYLRDRSLAAFLDGLAAAYGQSQVSQRESKNGTLTTFVSGNTYQFAAAQGLSKTAEEISDYVRERASNAFDVVYVPQATAVQVILQSQVNIDYDLNARKTSYLQTTRGVTYD